MVLLQKQVECSNSSIHTFGVTSRLLWFRKIKVCSKKEAAADHLRRREKWWSKTLIGERERERVSTLLRVLFKRSGDVQVARID